MRDFLKKSYILIGFVIFFLIIKSVDFEYLKSKISEIRIIYVFLAVPALICAHFFRALRWKTIMSFQKISYSFKNSLLMYGASSLLGAITPGKIGDFSRIAYLKKDGHSMAQSSLGNFLEKFLDLAFAFFFVSVGISYLPLIPYLDIDYTSILKWGLLSFVAAILLIFALYKKGAGIHAFICGVFENLKKLKLKEAALILLLTLFDWFAYFLIIYFLAFSIDITEYVGFLYLSFSATFIVIVSLLPISVLGIGTRDAALIFLLSPFGLGKETIILFSFLILLNSVAVLPLFLFCWLKKPII